VWRAPEREGVNRLVTITFSHYCEKARWALDRARVPYVEEAHLPLFAWVPALRAGRRRTVPSLLTGDGAIADSTDILHWADRHGDAMPLFPDQLAEVAELEEHYDRVLGPHARRLAYGHVLPALRELVGDVRGVPRAEAVLARTFARPIAAIMRRGLRVTPERVDRSRQRVDEIFAEVAARLADGRRYLVGDRFTAADLTFAALATPVIGPPELAEYLPVTTAPPAMLAMMAHYRDTPAGAIALRLYAEDRGRPGQPN
jgi:glutathione S-transferase